MRKCLPWTEYCSSRPPSVADGSFTVHLKVGTGGSAFGLAASPIPVFFSVAAGSGIASQNVGITFNGSPITITGLTSTPNSGQGWLQPSISGIEGAVLVTVSPTLLFLSSDTGTVVVSTALGQVSFQVTLIVG